MGDDEAGGLAIGREEHRQATFEVGVVERFRRQVEGIVVSGRVERLPHRGRVLLCGIELGNVYYYFKTKDDIVAAVVEARTEEIRSATAALQRRHGSPKARLKALVGLLADARDTVADHGCPLGTLCAELANQPGQSPSLTAPLMQTLLDWAAQQFHAVGRRDARDLAVELVIAYEGSAVLTKALAQPEIMAREARRLEKWINALQV